MCDHVLLKHQANSRKISERLKMWCLDRCGGRFSSQVSSQSNFLLRSRRPGDSPRSLGAFLKAKGVFPTVSHVQEAVLILGIFIQRPHCCAETQDKRVVVILWSALSPVVSKLAGAQQQQTTGNHL